MDDKTVQFVANTPMSLNTFLNNCCVWICILPSHVLKDVPADQLATYDWFQHPDVVDGPYILDDYDSAHYISYHANENYFLGAPKIEKLNFRIIDPSEVLPELKSGEIDNLLDPCDRSGGRAGTGRLHRLLDGSHHE